MKYTLASSNNQSYGYSLYDPEGVKIGGWDEKKNPYHFVYRNSWERIKGIPGAEIVEVSLPWPHPETYGGERTAPAPAPSKKRPSASKQAVVDVKEVDAE